MVLRHQQGEAGDLARHEADAVEPVGQGRRPLPAGHAWSRARSATSPTTARSSRSRKASTACCTSATCRWTRKISHPSEVVEKGQEVECKVLSRRSGAPPHRAGPQAAGRRSVGDRHPEPLPAGPGREGQGHEDHQLRRVRRPGRRPRRPAAHLGAGRPQGREPGGRGQGRRRDRSEDPARRCRRAEDRPVAQARRMGRGRPRGEEEAAGGRSTAAPAAELKGGVGSGTGPLFKTASRAGRCRTIGRCRKRS